jgi:hypothetical protein
MHIGPLHLKGTKDSFKQDVNDRTVDNIECGLEDPQHRLNAATAAGDKAVKARWQSAHNHFHKSYMCIGALHDAEATAAQDGVRTPGHDKGNERRHCRAAEPNSVPFNVDVFLYSQYSSILIHQIAYKRSQAAALGNAQRLSPGTTDQQRQHLPKDYDEFLAQCTWLGFPRTWMVDYQSCKHCDTLDRDAVELDVAAAEPAPPRQTLVCCECGNSMNSTQRGHNLVHSSMPACCNTFTSCGLHQTLQHS